jgi:hypothetical protein
MQQETVGDTWQTIQDTVFAEIKSSATLSLGTIEHANFAGCLENPTAPISFEKHLQERNPKLTRRSHLKQ